MKPYIGGYKIRIRDSKIVAPWSQLIISWIKLETGLYSFSMTFRFSTSISNFAERVRGKHGIYEWSFLKSMFEPTVFIGLYHPGDWLRIILHRELKLAFWCGSDILRIQGRPIWQWLIRHSNIEHVCENEVECMALAKMRIHARIHPILFFDDVDNYEISYKHSNNPHVWLTCHPGREREYGVELIEEIAEQVPEVTFHIFGISKPFHTPWFDPISGELMNFRMMFNKNTIYHGQVPSEEMDKMIKNYQAGFRANEFDGCPHVVTKGMLLGQWTISRIPYPHCATYKTKEELIKLLKGLKYKKKPNIEGRKHWIKVLNKFPWS